MQAAKGQLTKADKLYRDFMTLPPGTRELVAKNYLDAMVQAIVEEKPKPKNRYEMLMADDILGIGEEHLAEQVEKVRQRTG